MFYIASFSPMWLQIKLSMSLFIYLCCMAFLLHLYVRGCCVFLSDEGRGVVDETTRYWTCAVSDWDEATRGRARASGNNLPQLIVRLPYSWMHATHECAFSYGCMYLEWQLPCPSIRQHLSYDGGTFYVVQQVSGMVSDLLSCLHLDLFETKSFNYP